MPDPSFDPWQIVNGRFTSIDNQQAAFNEELDEVRGDQAELSSNFSALQEHVKHMTDSFTALRTALYTAAFTIAVAAVMVVLLGRPSL